MAIRITPRLIALIALVLTLVYVAYNHQDQLYHRETLSTALAPVQRACTLCESSPEFCRSFGERNLDMITAYEGSGDRIRRVLNKARRGEPINYGIIGGSLSRGHGCHCTTFHKQIFDWWNETFPHPENFYADGSVGARGSNYFKFCYFEHLKDDADLVILELSLNDDATEGHAKNVESLLRAILMWPRKPAVILTASFSLMGKMAMGNDVHLPVAQYYDVPVINLRHALGPIVQKRPDMVDEFFAIKSPTPNYRDQLHLSEFGHWTLAQSTIAFLERQKCIAEQGLTRQPPNDGRFVGGENYDVTIPRLTLLSDKWSPDGKARIEKPSCSSIDSKDHPLTPLPSTRGWAIWNQPKTTKYYWRATEVGSHIDFNVYLAEGHVMLYYLRSRKMSLGRVACWLNDDEKNAVTIDGYWERPDSIGQYFNVRENKGRPLDQGNYTLHCRLLERHYGKEEGRGTTFLIIAVLTV
ncbi:hypothetical protein EXIGLDRAFT_839230 [Exidia glandulosa HHB12029]|uniref:SGNH hydrolase-type esterase domain-containing protein n=1 Tax=Exidia glandulosa HHB12029 TaxID=1314781 RepID=A0A165F631_EXIGL|nr:hypothetical protein EXIGLDRAFT_839230 [Exidia glandulosa HHB12029]